MDEGLDDKRSGETDGGSGVIKKGKTNEVIQSIIKTANKANPLKIPKGIRSSMASPISSRSKDQDKPKSKKASIFWKGLEKRPAGYASDEAEDAVLASVEERSKNTKTSEDGFRPAVKGESPPLQAPTFGNAFKPRPRLSSESSISAGKKGSSSSRSLADKIQAMNQQIPRPGPLTRQQSNPLLPHQGQGQHRRAHTLLASIDGQHESSGRSSDAFGFSTKDLFSGFDKIYGDDNDDDREDNPSSIDAMMDDGNQLLNDYIIKDERKSDEDNNPSETLPLLHGDTYLGNPSISEGQLNRARKVLTNSHWKWIRELFNPLRIASRIYQWFIHSTMMIAFPLFICAWILYYRFGNPAPPDFLPSGATLSWYFNFTGRQLVMFELARFSQYVVIDSFILSFRFVSHALGSWITIFCTLSKG